MIYGQLYVITNLVNGKKYVGQTIKDIQDRFYEHRREKNDSLIHRAIKKHGEENFIIEPLAIAFTRKDLDSAERSAIKVFNCLVPNGYNIHEGGQSGGKLSDEIKQKISDRLKGRPARNKGIPRTEEEKRKISRGSKGKTLSEETKRKISEANKGENSPNYGKPAFNKGIPMREESKLKKRTSTFIIGSNKLLLKGKELNIIDDDLSNKLEYLIKNQKYTEIMEIYNSLFWSVPANRENQDITVFRRKIMQIRNGLYKNIMNQIDDMNIAR